MFPTNSTGISAAGALKWMAIISGVVFLIKAYQGIVDHKGSTGVGRTVGQPLSGEAAVSWGWENLTMAGVSFAIAFALWFFWQRNEE